MNDTEGIQAQPQEAASLYIRLSKEAGDSNLSREGMEKDLRVLAAQHNYKVHAVHIDDGLSGAIRNRPEFLDWLNDAKTGQAQALLTWHADRLTREGVNAAALVLDTVEGKDPETGKVVRPPVRLLDNGGTDSFGDETSFRFKFVIAAEIARAERNRIKDRNAAAQRRLRENGRYRGGYVPYGYRVIDHELGGKALEIDPREAGIVRAAAQEILDGRTLYSVVRELNEAGVEPRKAAAWTLPSLKNVLIGDAVLGRISHKGQPLRGQDGLPVAPWAPILTLDESERLRAILTAAGRRNSGQAPRLKATRLLSGLLECKSCGQKLRVNQSRRRAGGPLHARYLCFGASMANCEHPVATRAEALEEHIEQEFLTRYGRHSETVQIYSARERVGLAEVEAALRDLSTQMIEPDADVLAIADQISQLQARRKELLAVPEAPTVRTVKTGKTLRQAWDEGDTAARRALLEQAFDGKRIVVGPGTPGGKKSAFSIDRYEIPWSRVWLPESDYDTVEVS